MTKSLRYTSHAISAEYEPPPVTEGRVRVDMSETFARLLYEAIRDVTQNEGPNALMTFRSALGASTPGR